MALPGDASTTRAAVPYPEDGGQLMHGPTIPLASRPALGGFSKDSFLVAMLPCVRRGRTSDDQYTAIAWAEPTESTVARSQRRGVEYQIVRRGTLSATGGGIPGSVW